MKALQGKTVGVLGLGQVGGSLAWAIKTHRPETRVIGFDIKPRLMTEAQERMSLDLTVESAVELIEQADIVVLALPIDGIIETISNSAAALHEKLLVTDVGSVMKDIVDAAKAGGLHNFISGHPLAGSEKRGSEAWTRTLFDGANYFLTEPKGVCEKAQQAMQALIRTVGSEPVKVRAMAHDLAFATTSNIPHVLAFCLVKAYERLSEQVEDQSRFQCPSYRGATRIAVSDPNMVFQMLWHNRNNLAGALRSLTGELEIVRQAMVDDEPDMFRRALGLGPSE